MSKLSEVTSESNLLKLPANANMKLNVKPKAFNAQQLNVSGSATGNPRNKCALQPGHSLMDWIRLGNSGVDLAGTRGQIRAVTLSELAMHNTREDAWIAIRGKVYNVTRYLHFHPGGVDELMRGVGRDATRLFDEVHAWVNYTQLLQKCYIGPLRIQINLSSSQSFKKSAKLSNSTLPPIPTGIKTATMTLSDIVPRFDWLQKRNDITLYLYTRNLCNPGISLQYKSNTELHILLKIAHITHKLQFKLHAAIVWPAQGARIFNETGKIELTFSKAIPDLWPTYGEHTQTQLNLDSLEEFDADDFVVVHCKPFSHDSFELCLKGKSNILYLLPIAYNVSIEATVNGTILQRSYTPVNAKYLTQSTSHNDSYLNFLIKSYDNGALSSYLSQLKLDDTLKVYAPKGNLNLMFLSSFKYFIFLAAGSGLTPFLNLIDHLLRRVNNKIEKLQLYYFNKTEADIWCREQLTNLAEKDERFHFENILSAADDNWSGRKGRISKELLQAELNNTNDHCNRYLAICGPDRFNQCTIEILEQLKFNTKEHLHVF